MEEKSFFNDTFGLSHGRFGWLNACVGTNGFPDTITYGEGYLKTPKILIEYIVNNNKRGEVDYLIYPIAYSARHGIELFLKKILIDISSLRDIRAVEREITSIHSLEILWNAIKNVSNRTDKALMHLVTKSDLLIKDFYEIDDTAQTFRYPESNVGETHLKKTPIINLIRFLHYFEKLKNNLEELLIITESLKREYKLNAHTANLSRRELIKLANQLMNKSEWNTTLTDKKKTLLKTKFNLTSNKQFIHAIDKIKDNRYLSSIIGIEKPLLHLKNEDVINFKKAWFKIHARDLIKRRDFISGRYEDLGTDHSQIKTEEFLSYLTLQAKTKKEYLPRFTPEKIADLTALLIIGRQSNSYFPEDYEAEVERHLHDARRDIAESYKYLIDNRCAMQYIKTALQMLGCHNFAVECHLSY